jgi:hypothetical protein
VVHPEKLIGKLVSITDKESNWYNHWGFIRDWDGDVFHVSGGSIAYSDFGTIPIFDRDQLTLPRKLDAFIKAGAKVDKDGREIR